MILRVIKYYDEKTVNSYMKVVDRNFIEYKQESKETNKEIFNKIVEDYINSNNINNRRR